MISICMPYYSRQEALDRSLASLRKHYAEDELEIVICDDGSPVPVVAPGCVVVSLPVKDHALNPCVPINRAVAHAAGDVIVLTNPEIAHRSPVLIAMADGLGPHDYVLAACRDTSGPWLCASHVRPGENGRGPMPPGSGFHFCAMLRRSLFDRAGGFDEDYREGQAFDDNDWLFRLQRAGARFRMRDDLVVWHHRVPGVWPAGGYERNRRLFEAKWEHLARLTPIMEG
jgi:glycosyltransferase involved in cell wall biosynthesis